MATQNLTLLPNDGDSLSHAFVGPLSPGGALIVTSCDINCKVDLFFFVDSKFGRAFKLHFWFKSYSVFS